MILPVILAGGYGNRLWPLSTKENPKQFLPLLSTNSMLQDTLKRISILKKNMLPPIIVGNLSHRSLIISQIRECTHVENFIMFEPCGKGTAVAAALTAIWVKRKYAKNIVLVILPADHFVDNNIKFRDILLNSRQLAENFLVAFGVNPLYEETGYGYISYSETISQDIYKIISFKEKPDKQEALDKINQGNCFWNSGIYMFSSDVFLEELKKFQPEIYEMCYIVSTTAQENSNEIFYDNKKFEEIPENSIDHAVMEKSTRSVVVELKVKWNDIGSWNALWKVKNDILDNIDGNVIIGPAFVTDTKNTLLKSDGRLVVAIGVTDLAIVDTKNVLLVIEKAKSQKLKAVYEEIRKIQPKSEEESNKVYRPWGWYEILEKNTSYLVKKLLVLPGSILSLQVHKYRSEHWTIVKGNAKVTRDKEIFYMRENDYIYIPVNVTHRIENTGDTELQIIEIQTGVKIDENDIIRYDDKYGR